MPAALTSSQVFCCRVSMDDWLVYQRSCVFRPSVSRIITWLGVVCVLDGYGEGSSGQRLPTHLQTDRLVGVSVRLHGINFCTERRPIIAQRHERYRTG